jgi:hypothetical protein
LHPFRLLVFFRPFNMIRRSSLVFPASCSRIILSQCVPHSRLPSQVNSLTPLHPGQQQVIEALSFQLSAISGQPFEYPAQLRGRGRYDATGIHHPIHGREDAPGQHGAQLDAVVGQVFFVVGL